ncbi:hypothetical protein Pmar_PMAR001412 [Perkinsus marinus ATCC 50983]|uniref:Uncharacterized protein n=1 Tax=Perkinsus marinus (strain ATCC 50983 / TXsc) TaxID=423536 RepID=C5KJM6_PERM5|nr:hypothetical protein Pmar_PMAR001412 [Perkinsus marinus ATCC 50983]EER15360.1 hypothetical protein Pmar_PMAR001412 [Perkinsus marinus ATCC 50983]|eukprot:XP_002783564.1 hypothetical protein Pmar_PMAR001412 [Perkinsus marinus ATCC 50983]
MRTMLLLVLMCGFASLVGGSVRHVSAPQGCTGVRKPSSSQFCAVGTIDTDASKVNITIYIFDIDDPSKSVYFHIQLAANGSEPAGLNITGGGIAKVNIVQVVKGMLFVPIRLSAETVAGGRGHYDPSTGRWTADITVIADADFMVSGCLLSSRDVLETSFVAWTWASNLSCVLWKVTSTLGRSFARINIMSGFFP